MTIVDDVAREREELLARAERVAESAVVRTLAEILEDPDALKPPKAVVPRVAWENRVTLLAGREKLGKSTLASAVAASYSRGAFLFGQRCEQGSVLIFNLEEFVGDVAQRLVRFGADPENVLMVDRLIDPLREFEELVRGLKPGLVIVDTLTAFADLTPEGAPDAGNASEWTSIMMALARPCRDSGAALLVLHHARKSDGKYRDSTAIGAGVDMILEMHEGKDADTRKVEAKGRFPVDNYSFMLVGDALQLTDGELAIEARVLTYIINNPGEGTRKVRDGVGARASEVDEAVRVLLGSDSIHDHGTGSRHEYYSPPACPEACPASSAHQPDLEAA